MPSRSRRAKVSTRNIGPDEGGNIILAAWQGLYHLFGARVERFDISTDGVTAFNLTFGEGVEADTLLENLISHNGEPIRRRLPFFPLYFWATGEAPNPFNTSLELTGWMTSFIKGPGRGRSPQYVKDAINQFKIDNGLAVPRGRPRKNLATRIAELGELDSETLQDVPVEELTKLREAIDSVVSAEV